MRPLKELGHIDIFTIWEDDEGQLWAQPPDNLPPLPYVISDTVTMPGLERSEKKEQK